MINKKFVLLFLIFISLIAISPVCAKENNTEVLVSNQTGTFSELSDLINTEQGDTLNLTKDYVYDDNSSTEGIYINKSITIEGNGYCLDGKNMSRIFNVNASNVTFKNIIFRNGFSQQLGGAIYFETMGYIENSSFVNNTAKHGGAIYANDTITCTNSIFIENIVADHGGAIFSNVNVIIYDSYFISNQAEEGGAIYSPKAIINNSFFELNAASVSGGAFYLINDSSIRNSTFKSNSAGTTGGAIYSYNLTVLNNSFISNIANWGSAIYSNVFATINNSYFAYNSADTYGTVFVFTALIDNSTFFVNEGTYGGALCVLSSCDVLNSEFRNNSGYSGGAIYVAGDLTIKNSSFYNNSATDASNNIALMCGSTLKYENVSYSSPLALNFMYMQFEKIKSNIYGFTTEITMSFSYNSSEAVNFGKVNVTVNGKTYQFNVKNGYAVIDIPNLSVGNYEAKIVYDFENFTQSETIVNFDVYNLIVENSKSYIVNYGGNYYVTLKDYQNKPVVSKEVLFSINGVILGVTKTNSKGVATFKLTPQILKTLGVGKKNLVISLVDNENEYTSKTVKISIIKENTKFKASKKTFKKSSKIKKYTVILKNSKGKAMKKVKITLKIKGKTYTAKTSSKGKATFKITKFYKRGKFTSVLKYKGSAYYKAVSKKVRITVK